MDDNDVSIGWFKKAENDLKNAEFVIKMINPPTDTICFHCQQTAEKYLKGYLAFFGKEIPKIHDLEELISLCENIDLSFSNLYEIAIELTDYAVVVRYPGIEYEIPIEDAEQSIEQAKKIKNFVLESIKDKETKEKDL